MFSAIGNRSFLVGHSDGTYEYIKDAGRINTALLTLGIAFFATGKVGGNDTEFVSLVLKQDNSLSEEWNASADERAGTGPTTEKLEALKTKIRTELEKLKRDNRDILLGG